MTRHAVDFDLREDEQSAWIAVELVPAARVGDELAVSSAHFAETRTGVVAETVDDDSRGSLPPCDVRVARQSRRGSTSSCQSADVAAGSPTGTTATCWNPASRCRCTSATSFQPEAVTTTRRPLPTWRPCSRRQRGIDRARDARIGRRRVDGLRWRRLGQVGIRHDRRRQVRVRHHRIGEVGIGHDRRRCRVGHRPGGTRRRNRPDRGPSCPLARRPASQSILNVGCEAARPVVVHRAGVDGVER